jgi:hypothetical protein
METPWSSLDPFDLLGRIKTINPNPTRVADWGCGMNHSPISKQVRDLHCGVLYSIDAWPEYIAYQYSNTFLARVHIVMQGDVEAVLRHWKKYKPHVDLSLCLDIVEHLEKSAAIKWLKGVEKVSDAVLIWIPLGYAPITQDTYGGSNHELHTHRSSWEKEDLEKLGYAVEVLENFHTPMFGHRVDGGWAVKFMKEK